MLINLFLTALLPCILGFSKRVNIGGLFDKDDMIQRAFELSVRLINKQRHESDVLANVFFVQESHEVATDAFQVSEKVCELFAMGVAGIFGPQDKVSARHVQSMCNMMEVPHVTTRWDPEQDRLKAVNLYPHADTFSLVFYHLVKEFEWKTYTILYDSSDSLIRMHRVLKRWDPKGYPITVRHLGDGPNFRHVLQDVKHSGEENIIIDCSYEILAEVLKQAQQVGLVSDRHRLIVSSLDLQTLDLEPYKYAGMNFTGIRLINPEEPMVEQIVKAHLVELGIQSVNELRVEQALMFDAVQLFARAFKQLKDAIKGDIKQLPCNGSQSWEHGISLSNFMRSTEMMGLTGLVKFDTSGYRSDFELDIVEVQQEGVNKIGTWNSTSGIEWIPKPLPAWMDKELSLRNTTFRILIALTKPYGMLKETSKKMSGNDQFEGFAIDIILEISNMLGFNYTFIVQEDNKYGTLLENGQWNGMIRRIMDNEADLAITDLTITSDRESAVDFTMPFMNLGISILYRKPVGAPPSLFSFLSPFSNQVWLYLIGSYMFTSLLFFIVGRLCPAEWNNPYPCVSEPDELQNQFTLKNSLWFTIGALMQQGSEIAPIGNSTRMIAGSWWFFCLIIVSSYTANLAAFLTVETVVRPIKDVDDLANQETIKYGAKKDGSTLSFFKDSNDTRYQKMHKYMLAHANEVLPPDNDVGKNKVLHENYAYLMESSSIEYLQERECNLSQIGGLLDSKGYGIAMRKNASYRNDLSSAVLKLNENGILSKLKTKWWKEKRGGGRCNEDSGTGQATELDMDNVGGVFLVLFVGVGLSCIGTVWEFIWEIVYLSHKENKSVKEEFMEEIKFVVKCSDTTKPVRNRKSSSNESGKDSRRGSTPLYGFVPAVLTTNVGDGK